MKAKLKQILNLIKAQKCENPMIFVTEKNVTVKGIGYEVLGLLSDLFIAFKKIGIEKEDVKDIVDLSYEDVEGLIKKLKELYNREDGE